MKIGEAYVELRADSAKLRQGLRNAEGLTKRAASRLGMMFRVGVGVAASLFFRKAIKESLAFEKQMANVATMLDDVNMQLPRMAKGVATLAVRFGQTTETMAKGLYDILSASIDASRALDVLEIAARAATGGMTDTAVAADAVTTILNAYQKDASEAGRVTDILFATVKRGKTTFQELASGIGRVAATAATAEVSFEEVGAVLATMTRAGINTYQSVNALNGILMAFVKASEKGRKVAAGFGLDLSVQGLAANGLIGSLAKLKKANLEQLATIVPNRRAIKGLTALMKQLEGAQYDLAFATSSTGQAEAAFLKATDTAAFQLEQQRQAFLAGARAIGDKFTPALAAAGKALHSLAEGIDIAIESTSELVGAEHLSKLEALRKRYDELGSAALTVAERIAIGEVPRYRTEEDKAAEIERQKRQVIELEEALRKVEESEKRIKLGPFEKLADPLTRRILADLGAEWEDLFSQLTLARGAIAEYASEQKDAAEAARAQAESAANLVLSQRAAEQSAKRWVETIKGGVGALAGISKEALAAIGFDVGYGPMRAGIAQAEAARLKLEDRRAEAGRVVEGQRHAEVLANIASELAARKHLTSGEMEYFELWRAAERERHRTAMAHLKEQGIKEMIARDFAWEDELDKFTKAKEEVKKVGIRMAGFYEGIGGRGRGAGARDPEEETAKNTKTTADQLIIAVTHLNTLNTNIEKGLVGRLG